MTHRRWSAWTRFQFHSISFSSYQTFIHDHLTSFQQSSNDRWTTVFVFGMTYDWIINFIGNCLPDLALGKLRTTCSRNHQIWKTPSWWMGLKLDWIHPAFKNIQTSVTQFSHNRCFCEAMFVKNGYIGQSRVILYRIPQSCTSGLSSAIPC